MASPHDVAETSDSEEREILEATQSAYWEASAFTMPFAARSACSHSSPGTSQPFQQHMNMFPEQSAIHDGTSHLKTQKQPASRHHDPELSSPSSSRHETDAIQPSSPNFASSSAYLEFPSSSPLPPERHRLSNQLASSSPVSSKSSSAHPTPPTRLSRVYSSFNPHPSEQLGHTTSFSAFPLLSMASKKTSSSHISSFFSTRASATDQTYTLSAASKHSRADTSAGITDEGSIRYSFRHRKAQQLNPYAFDKILYHRQMRSNPDAIVKSIRNHIAHTSSELESASDNSQDVYDMKSRGSISASDDDGNGMVDARASQKRKRVAPRRNTPLHTGNRDDEGHHVAPARWYPDVFQDQSSDEGLYPAISAARRAVRTLPHDEMASLPDQNEEIEIDSLSDAASTRSSGMYGEMPRHLLHPDNTGSIKSSVQEIEASTGYSTSDRGTSPGHVTETSRRSRLHVLNALGQSIRRRRPKMAQHRNYFPRARSSRKRRHRQPNSDAGAGGAQGGFSVLRSADGYVTGRLHRRQAITIDMEDVALQSALVPSPLHLRSPRSPSISASSQVSEADSSRFVTVDSGVEPIPRTFDFNCDSYLRKGWLQELLLVVADSSSPGAWFEHEFHGHRLPRNPSVDDFSVYVRSTTAVIHDIFTSSLSRNEDVRQACATMHLICQTISSLSARITDREYFELAEFVLGYTDTLTRNLDTWLDLSTSSSMNLDPRVIHVYWFCLETAVILHYSRPLTAIAGLSRCIKGRSLSVVHRLLQYSVNAAVKALHQDIPLDSYSPEGSAVQAWICMLHLCHALSSGNVLPTPIGTIWELIQETLNTRPSFCHPLADSEGIWHIIFYLNALSYLSTHGHLTSRSCLPVSWDMVAFALSKVRLSSHIALEAMLHHMTIVKRDNYIRVIVQRCLLLHHQWHWALDGALAAFNYIADVFKSRKFSNLSGDVDDFPAFMRHANQQLLFDLGLEDSTFVLFLKLLAKSTESIVPKTEPEYSNKIRRYLSVIVPVGSVHLENPGLSTDSELSMLYNRFGIISAAIYIHPLPSAVRHHLALARHYIKFSDSTKGIQTVCICALMYLAIQVQILGLPLEEILIWSKEITEYLLVQQKLVDIPEQKSEKEEVSDTLVSQHFDLLLQCFCHLVDSAPIHNVVPKLHVGFLEGIWLTEVLAIPRLVHAASIGSSIRHIICAYLHVCDSHQYAMMAKQESQDEYGQLELDMDDPELSAALGDSAQLLLQDDNQQHIDAILNIVKNDIVPLIYQLICHYSCYVEGHMSTVIHADMCAWVDCWIHCVNVLVQHTKEEWSTFLLLGRYSWGRIIDNFWRYSVGLQFMLNLLKVEPYLYQVYQQTFFQLWLQCLVAVKVTTEPQYLVALMQVDNYQHPCLQKLPLDMQQKILANNELDFQDLQIEVVPSLLNVICHALTGPTLDQALMTEYQHALQTIFQSVKDNYNLLINTSQEKTLYYAFYQKMYDVLEHFPSCLSFVSSLHVLI